MGIEADLVIYNISEVVRLPRPVRGPAREEDLGLVYDGVIAVKDGRIVYIGSREGLREIRSRVVIDAEGSIATPGLIDPHTHLIYSGSREDEFERLLQGASYEEILAEGGGILRTMRDTSRAPEEDLYRETMRRIEHLVASGVTTVEVKTGYGIDIESELRIIRVLERVRSSARIDVVPTLLAHIPPPTMARDVFIERFIEVLAPEARARGFMYIDVFCDRGAFTVEESRRILSRGASLGLLPRIHADELEYMGCSDMGLEVGAISIDHLNRTPRETLNKIAASNSVAVLSPTTSIYIARRAPDTQTLMGNRALIALTTDHSPALMNTDLIETMGLASIYFSMPPGNVLAGVTVNAAHALGLRDRGSIERGYIADIVLWDLKSYRFIGYEHRRDVIKYVLKRGEVVYSRTEKR